MPADQFQRHGLGRIGEPDVLSGNHRHVAEAQRLGLAWRSLPDPDLGWDVDEPADLEFQTST